MPAKPSDTPIVGALIPLRWIAYDEKGEPVYLRMILKVSRAETSYGDPVTECKIDSVHIISQREYDR